MAPWAAGGRDATPVLPMELLSSERPLIFGEVARLPRSDGRLSSRL